MRDREHLKRTRIQTMRKRAVPAVAVMVTPAVVTVADKVKAVAAMVMVAVAAMVVVVIELSRDSATDYRKNRSASQKIRSRRKGVMK